MKESVCQFGPKNAIFGILCEPNRLDPDLPVVLFLNAGLLHHVGPFGWYTVYARRLASLGIASLRFDLSGIGESLPRSNGQSNREMAIADVIDAMNEMQKQQIGQRFVLLGLCAGAVVAHHAAAHDNRIIGIISLDGVSYRTKRFYIRHFANRCLKISSWMTIWRRLSGIRSAFELSQPNVQAEQAVLEAFLVERTTREEIRSLMLSILSRGVKMLQVYSGNKQWYFNHRNQFFEMFGSLPDAKQLIQVEYLKYADHLFTLQAEREHMFQICDKWIDDLSQSQKSRHQIRHIADRKSIFFDGNARSNAGVSIANQERAIQ